MWNFIYIYLLVFSDQILKSDSIPHTLAAVTQRQHFLPGSEERMNQHSAGLWSPAVGCDCRLWWWEGSHLRFESTPNSPSREAHAQGRNLKVIKNQSQRCVWKRNEREIERGHFDSYVHWWSSGSGMGGTLSGKWITVVQCSGDFNESRAVEKCLKNIQGYFQHNIFVPHPWVAVHSGKQEFWVVSKRVCVCESRRSVIHRDITMNMFHKRLSI